MLRPAVVWFNEVLDPIIVEKSYARLQETDVLLIIGTSGLVYPVANFPFIAKQENKQIVIIEFNLESTPLSPMVNKTVLGPVEDTLPEFVSKIIKNS
jgi:NAD-dependent SIR2 family protein deacetylase